MGLMLSLPRLRRSSSSDFSAETLHVGDYNAEKKIPGDGLTRPLAQDVSSESESDTKVDVSVVSSSDSDTDIELDIDAVSSSDSDCDSESDIDEVSSSDSDSDTDLGMDEEELGNIGESFWVHESFLAHLSQPKDTDIICYCQGEPGNRYWMAIAPEFPCVVPAFESSMEKAAEELQIMLVLHKSFIIERKDVYNIKTIPMNPRTKSARRIRMGYRDGYFDKLQKADYDRYEKESSAVV